MHIPNLDEVLDKIYHLLIGIVRDAELETRYHQDVIAVLEKARSAEDPHTSYTLLPVLACVTCGGEVERVVPVAAAWRALHIAAHLFDSVQDQDVALVTDSPTARALTINVATGLLALANLALQAVPRSIAEQTRHILYKEFQQAIVRAAGGQHMEFTRPEPHDLNTYFRIVALKSGEPFALAVQSGGLVAGATEGTLVRFRTFGYNVGVLVQLMDDWRDFVSNSGNGHLYSLPLVYALSVASSDEGAQLREEWARSREERERAQHVRDMVRKMGGISYTLGEIFRHFERAVSALAVKDDHLLREWLLGMMARFSFSRAMQ